MKLKRFYLCRVYNEAKGAYQLVRCSAEGRNLSRSARTPTEYPEDWWLVFAVTLAEAKEKLARGDGLAMGRRVECGQTIGLRGYKG